MRRANGASARVAENAEVLPRPPRAVEFHGTAGAETAGLLVSRQMLLRQGSGGGSSGREVWALEPSKVSLEWEREWERKGGEGHLNVVFFGQNQTLGRSSNQYLSARWMLFKAALCGGTLVASDMHRSINLTRLDTSGGFRPLAWRQPVLHVDVRLLLPNATSPPSAHHRSCQRDLSALSAHELFYGQTLLGGRASVDSEVWRLLKARNLQALPEQQRRPLVSSGSARRG